jgi:hypothetical protein
MITSPPFELRRQVDYDYGALGGLIVTHRDKSGKDKALSESSNATLSH